MSFRNVSKFRFVKAKENAKQVYGDLRLADPSPTSHSIACSSKFVAANLGAQSSFTRISILPVNHAAWASSIDPPVVHAHSDVLGDLAFSPFNPNLLCTSSRDGTCKLWDIPEEGLTAPINNPRSVVEGFDGGVNSIQFHLSASDVLAVASKNAVSVVDLVRGETKTAFRTNSAGQDMLDVAWSFDGSSVLAASKDANLRLFDPRTEQVGAEFKLGDLRPTKSICINDEHTWLVCGADRMRSPSIAIMDGRRPGEAIFSEKLEFSAGTLLPLYDFDSKLLYLSMRGSNMLSYYDIGSSQNRLVRLDALACRTPIIGLTSLPKYACNVLQCEVNRLFKLSRNSVDTLNCSVERKASGFHEDLFPPTFSNKPVLTNEQYMGGENAAPWLLSPDPTKALFELAQNIDYVAEEKKIQVETERKLEENRKEEEKKAYFSKSENRSQLDSRFKQSRYKNIIGKEPQAQSLNDYYYQLQPGPSVALSQNLVANPMFWATPWRSIGGSALLVHPLSNLGRVSDAPYLIRGHPSPVTAFDLAPRLPLLATGSMDAHVKLWRIPEQGLTEDRTEADVDVVCDGKITALRFHPLVDNVLFSADYGFDVATLKVWDVNTGVARFSMNGHQDMIQDLAFSFDGALVGTTCKDGLARIVDARAAAVCTEWQPAEGKKDTRILFVGQDSRHVLTIGTSKLNQRSVSVWDLRNQEQPVGSLYFDASNSCMLPYLDPDTNLLYVAHSGERMIHVIEVLGENPPLEKLAVHQSIDIVTGLAPRPKHTCDVASVTISNALVLTKRDTVMPVSFRIPRKRVEYFQDDLYPLTRSDAPLMSSDEWFDGVNRQPTLVSLQPAGMTPLSQAPPEELTDRQKKNIELRATGPAAAASRGPSQLFSKFSQVTSSNYVPKTSRWDAKRDETQEVADEDWD